MLTSHMAAEQTVKRLWHCGETLPRVKDRLPFVCLWVLFLLFSICPHGSSRETPACPGNMGFLGLSAGSIVKAAGR